MFEVCILELAQPILSVHLLVLLDLRNMRNCVAEINHISIDIKT